MEIHKRQKIKIHVCNKKDQRKHFHQEIELIYVLKGNIKVVLDEQEIFLDQEDIYIINANKQHQLTLSDDVLYVQLLIAYELISDVLESTEFMFWCNSTNNQNEEIEKLRIVIRKLLNHYLHGKDGVASFYYISLCYQMMDILTVHFLVRSIDREKSDKKDKFEERLAMINHYIWANYNQPISLQDLSNKLYLSNAYLSRFFKKHFGISFAKYITNIRLYHAIDELLFSHTPITKIAYDNGFPSVSAFNKAFKEEYGETPSVMRKKANVPESYNDSHKVPDEIHKQLEQYLSNTKIEDEKESEVKEIKANYSISNTKIIKPIWNQLINIGSAEDILRSEVQEHIVLLKNNLGFKYIRFWNIFSETLFIDVYMEEGEYNFSRVDSILDFLVENQLKPHIELGYKPKRIHKNVKAALLFEDNKYKHIKTSHWKRIMHAFMKHIAHRYGRNEIDSWRLEMWYDEWNLGIRQAIEEYYERFNSTYEIARNYSSYIEIGGCGIQMGYSLNVNQEFLYNWQQQKFLPDFISIMNYAYERGEENQEKYSKRSTDPACLLHAVQSMKADLSKLGMLHTKLYVTEWNLTISDRNYINDTSFKGAYIIKNILDIYGEVEVLGYFLGSDYVSEYYDSHMLLHGGMGLLSKDSIMKPAAFAYWFLNQLYPYLIGKEENYIISTDNHHNYAIVYHNQKVLNYNYYLSDEEQIEKEHTWKYFVDQDSLQTTIQLLDVENGEYQIKILRVNEQNGSILNLWKEMGFYQNLSLNDIKYLRRSCNTRMTIQKVHVNNNQIDIILTLAANELSLVKINKI